MAYETFAFVYDEIMDETLYDQWLAFTKRHLTKGQENILELACGTGDLAVKFAEEGYQVTGLDLSEEMLTIASQRGIEADLAIQWIQGDMLDLKDIGTYQAVTCYSDSLCYMKNAEDVVKVFQGVFDLLEKDGTFIFDVHSTYQIDQVFPEYSFHDQTEEFAFLWDSYPGEEPHSIEHFLTFFVKKGELFERFDELHQERTYSLNTYQVMLAEVGFSFEVFADFEDENPKENSQRWFFVCHKS
ncbi:MULTISPECIES: class I SAM-dependent DNA methyltransferase [Enterococcus]|uniref:Class I SAM-dependent methyltransferase n=1 Tax=Enterococcus alishanensis TaxID=1303817 RepID=A0ABS6TAI8_9ENTE|nr:class I SAM-dependent methyltransferase [Enterococcus alishanensis]MBV7389921.1 class I SAM-dependent methyltransferase [Enterococcus alishanensis]